MKSLDKLSYIEHRIEYLTNYVKELEKENIKCDIEIQKERIEIYRSIKQDLEVLEIIWKKKVDVCELIGCMMVAETDEEVLENYNVIRKNEYKLTMEELMKIAVWLEENQNDR